jgi:hypothetical protein
MSSFFCPTLSMKFIQFLSMAIVLSHCCRIFVFFNQVNFYIYRFNYGQTFEQFPLCGLAQRYCAHSSMYFCERICAPQWGMGLKELSCWIVGFNSAKQFSQALYQITLPLAVNETSYSALFHVKHYI